MRIQHNVTALNAYRNLRGNNLNLAKNLEKLSSGYRINRAGDDAAGLAISEKMRAQISGLDSAKKNAEDGISLVQTAEGALTEVHSMLNRMVTLATQSANGTYDNEVDRANLQKEVTALKSEIDRISESANFNGIKLLDGSMSDEAKVAGEVHLKFSTGITGADVNAIKGKYTSVAFAELTKDKGGVGDGGKLVFNLTYKNGVDGKEVAKAVKFDVKVTGATAGKLIAEDGTEYDIVTADSQIKGSAAQFSDIISKELKKDKELTKLFDISQTAADGTAGAVAISYEAKTAGSKGALAVAMELNTYNKDGQLQKGDLDAANGTQALTVGTVRAAQDAGVSYALDAAKVFGSNALTAGGVTFATNDINKAVFEVNGKKFAFISQDLTQEEWAAVKSANINYVAINATNDKLKAADIKEMVNLINQQTGLEAVQGTNTTGTWKLDDAAGVSVIFKNSSKLQDKSLTLQIGDTAEDFNKMKVSVQSTSTKSLKIDDVDISNQAGAAEAIGKIKTAINTVSSVRGDLGALQNRLEHTINNLGVMHENITDAESRIRDTDMAKEMMAYAKNNILVQSSTAMLAQANQLPQSVLQLLQ